MTPERFVLLVEDNPGDARLTALLLEDGAASGLPPLRWVQSAEAARALLATEKGCLVVLLDLGLPDSEGLDSLHLLVEAEERVPIIILTGSDSELICLEAMNHGAQDFLVKGSFDAVSLRRSITFARRRKEAEVAVVERALRDELTGLPRRTLLLDRLQAAMRHARRSATTGAVLFLDLDGCKAVNDSGGHAAGDAVLRAVASRLQAAVRTSDTVSRLGGDEFVALLWSVAHAGDAVLVASKILDSVNQPIFHEALVLQVSASIGVVHFDGGEEGADALVARADAAMYQAKGEGKGRVVEH